VSEPIEKNQRWLSIGSIDANPIDTPSNNNLFKIVDEGPIQNMLDAEENNQNQDLFIDKWSYSNNRRDRETIKSTPRIKEVLPEFGYPQRSGRIKIKKIRSENDRSNSNEIKDNVTFSDRDIGSSSKRSSFKIKLPKKYSAKKNSSYLVLSSSNSSRSKSKKRIGLALTMNPISSANFKYAIGNLPIKVSRDDDMLFSFRNQIMSNRECQSTLPESINSKHGKITYLMANLEDNIGQFFQDFKKDVSNFIEIEDDATSSKNDSSTELNVKGSNSLHDGYIDDSEENSLVTLLDINDQFDIIDDKSEEHVEHDQDCNKSNQSNENIDHTNKSIDSEKSVPAHKNHEPSLNFATIDPLKISKSSTTPKSRKRIKPLISNCKSAKSTHSKKQSKSKGQQISKTADRKIRKMLNNEKDSKKRVSKFSKQNISSVSLNQCSTSRNPSKQGKATSVSANRPYVKKSNILHTAKGSNSCIMGKPRQISSYRAPQSLRIKRDENSRLDENDLFKKTSPS